MTVPALTPHMGSWKPEVLKPHIFLQARSFSQQSNIFSTSAEVIRAAPRDCSGSAQTARPELPTPARSRSVECCPEGGRMGPGANGSCCVLGARCSFLAPGCFGQLFKKKKKTSRGVGPFFLASLFPVFSISEAWDCCSHRLPGLLGPH